MDLYGVIIAKYPDLVEISGRNIKEAGLCALGMINGSALTSVEFKNVHATNHGIRMLCKGNPGLKRLSLYITSESTVTDEGVRSIVEYCPDLEKLTFMWWNNPLDLSLDCLCLLPRLKELDLSGDGGLTSAAVMDLVRRNGANLVVLNLWGRVVPADFQISTSPLLLCLGEYCANLRELVLEISLPDTVENVGYATLFRGCRSLESLVLACFSDTTLLRVAEYCPRLRSLELRATSYTDVGIVAVVEGCKQLKSLKLHLAIQITDASMFSIAKNCPGLEEFLISEPNKVTDGALRQLFESFTQLTDVTLFAARQITDASVETLLQCNRRLKKVFLQHADITNETALALALFPTLESLTLKSRSFTDFTVRLIAEHCKKLKHIDLSHCPGVTVQGLKALLTHGKRLATVDFCNGVKLTKEIVDAHLARGPTARRTVVKYGWGPLDYYVL